MTRLQILACAFGITAIMNTGASASGFIKLGAADKSSGIIALGIAPVKKKKQLNLGVLRTRDARLPNGVLSLEGRMRLRAKHARSRQDAVTRARRNGQSEKRATEAPDSRKNAPDGDIVME